MAYPYSDRLKSYRYQVDFCLEMGEGPVLQSLREDIAALSLTDAERVELAGIDQGVIDYLLTLEHIDPQLIRDDEARPPAHWWWHLGKIRAKTFPAEQLPEALRAVYLETSKKP